MNRHSGPPPRAGAKGALFARGALVLSALLGSGMVFGVEGQPIVADSFSVGGDIVRLEIPLDSLIVVPLDSLELPDLTAIVTAVVPGAAGGRFPGGLGWVYWVPPMTREALVRAAREIQDHSRIRWAGFMVRRPGLGGSAMVTDETLIRFQPGLGQFTIDSMLRGWGVDVVREPGFVGDHHVVMVTDLSPGDALVTSNEAQLDPQVDYAQPNFIHEVIPSGRASGVLPALQWHHTNINTTGAWTLTRGDPDTKVAVIEFNGFDIDHPDLVARRWVNPWEGGGGTGSEPFDKKPGDLHGWNFEGCGGVASPLMSSCGTPDVKTANNTHGTQVAGLAAASENTAASVSGVCPGCSVMFISVSKHSGFSNSSEIRGAAYRYAYLQRADVINTSWHNFFPDNPVQAAIHAAATDGRDGKGAVIVTIPSNVSTTVFDFCSGPSRQMASVDSVIAVVQSDQNDFRQAKAKGACLHLVAPGHQVKTTDPIGTAGDSNTEYVDNAEGNSYAAPVVAGVAGLMLTRNPSLSWEEVKEILKETADKVSGPVADPAVYNAATGHSEYYGYGRVNAARAVGAVDAEVVVPPLEWYVNWPFVVPVEWRFDFVSGDHHLNEHGVWIDQMSFNSASARLEWRTKVDFADKNFDDDFWWEVSHGALSIDNAILASGESSWIESDGGLSSISESHQAEELVGLGAATVVLRGWQFDYANRDHHIDVIGIRLTDVNFDPATGRLTWNTTAEFQDREPEDDYRWRYQWLVIGLPEGAAVSVSRSGEDQGNTHVSESFEADDALRDYESAVVLTQGWRFDYARKDHEINRHRFGIRNVAFDPEAGRVDWAVALEYSDRNFDDDYGWAYDLAAIAFNVGTFFPWWGGPERDGGGDDQKGFSVIVR